MYKKGDLTVSLEEAQESANFANIPVEEWAEQYGWTLEGKTTVPGDTTPPTEPEKKTAAGDSSLADTSLESPEIDLLPGLQYAAEKDLFSVDETEGRKRLEAYFKGVPGIVFEEVAPGRDFLEIKYYDQNKNKEFKSERLSFDTKDKDSIARNMEILSSFISTNIPEAYSSLIPANLKQLKEKRSKNINSYITPEFTESNNAAANNPSLFEPVQETKVIGFGGAERSAGSQSMQVTTYPYEKELTEASQSIASQAEATGVSLTPENLRLESEKLVRAQIKNEGILNEKRRIAQQLIEDDIPAQGEAWISDVIIGKEVEGKAKENKQLQIASIEQNASISRAADNITKLINGEAMTVAEQETMVNDFAALGVNIDRNNQTQIELEDGRVMQEEYYKAAVQLGEMYEANYSDYQRIAEEGAKIDADIQNVSISLDASRRSYDLGDKALYNVGLGFGELGLATAQLAAEAGKSNNPVLKIVGPAIDVGIQNIQDRIDESRDQFVRDVDFKNAFDDPSNFGKFALQEVANQIPILVSMIASGGSAAYVAGATSAGSKMIEMKGERMAGDADYSDLEIALKATGYGLAEGAFAQITTVPILNRAKQTWVRAGKSDVVDGGTKAFFREKSTSLVYEPLLEAGGEIATQGTQNLIDGKPFMEGVDHAGVSGFGFGLLFAGIPFMKGMYSSRYSDYTAKESIRSKQLELDKLAAEWKVSQSDADMQRLEDQMSKLRQELTEDIEQQENIINNNLRAEHGEYIVQATEKQSKLQNEAKAIQDDASLSREQKKNRIEALRPQFDFLQRTKEQSLSEANMMKARPEFVALQATDKKRYDRLINESKARLMRESGIAEPTSKQIEAEAYEVYLRETIIENNNQAGKTKGADLKQFETREEAVAAIENGSIKVNESLVATIVENVNNGAEGFSLDGGAQVVIIENQVASQTQHTGTHEVGHYVFDKLAKNNEAKFTAIAIQLLKSVKAQDSKLYKELVASVETNEDSTLKSYEVISRFLELVAAKKVNFREQSKARGLAGLFGVNLQKEFVGEYNFDFKGEQDIVNFVVGLGQKIAAGTLSTEDIIAASENIILEGEVKGNPAVDAAIKEANANIKFSKDISGAAERAKQVLEKVSSNMDFFDPNSPLIARVLPGMIQAQLAKLSIKGLQFDMDEANSDIIYRLYSNGDINKFDGRGTLYGYINGRISFRIKDMLKASGEGKNDIVEDFNQSDVEDLKGAAADVTTTEQIEERTEAERPTYKPLLDSRMATPELLEAMESKIPRVVATAKNRIDAPVSKNTTVTPFVNEVRLALGKQLDIDLKKAMGGKKDGQLRKWLTSNKKAILENMTTTYLMSGFPASVQKKVNGVWTSDWKGKKIDRETTAVDKAGRTSGAEMVRRLPNASIKIDDKTFLSFVLEESGNPIRGKKESIAKAVAEEMAIEYINQQMQDSNSKIRQALEANQERLGYERIDNHVQKLALDFERGNVKFSKGLNRQQIRQDNIRASLRSAINLLLLKDEKLAFFEDKNSKNTFSKEAKKLLQAGAFIEKTINGKKKKIKVDISDVPFEAIYNTVQSLESEGLLQFVVQSYFSDLIIRSSLPVFNEDFLKEYSSLETLRKDIKDGNDKAIQELAAYESEIAAAVRFMNPEYIKAFGGSTIFGKGIIEKAGQKNIEYLESETELIRQETLAQISHYTAKSTSKTHLINRVIAAQRGTGTAKLTAQTGLAGDIQIANVANQRLVKYMATKLIEAVKKGDLAEKNLLRLLQDMNTNKKSSGFRSLGSLEYISSSIIGFKKGIPYVEHIYPNSSVAFDILSLAADDSFSLTDQEKLGADSINALDKIIAKNTLWATDNQTANTIDVLRTTNRSGIQRMKVFNEIAQAQIFSTVLNENGDLQTLKDDLENKEKVELYTKKIGIKWSKATAAKSIIRPSTKFSLSAPTAVFMVGGPGSGKSSILEELGLINKGYRLVNQDPYLEKYIKDSGLASDEKTYNKEERSLRAKLGWKARKAAEEDLARNTAAKESMVVDGTGASYKATTKKMKALEDAGFEIHMVFVNTSKDVAVQRNRARAERSLADFIVTKTWDSVQESAKQYKEDYAGRFYEINTDNLSYGESLPEAFVNKVNKGLEASGVKFSQGLSEELNDIIERTKGVDAEKIYSKAQARMMGEGKGKYRLFVPASAEDFRGLTSYTFAGKGKQGEADQKFIEDNIITPYTRGVAMIEAVKQQVRRELMALRKADKKLFKMLGKKITNSDYTYDHALRVYMWTQQGIKIPNMNKDDIRFLINAINAMPQLIEMGNAMQLISRQDTWMDPGEHWLSRTLVSDLNGMTEKVGRKKYLQEFIENSEAIFSPENLNKIEAIYGTRHREAIEDSLFAMTNGTNRTTGQNKQVNAWLNWVNNSTGAIMFFNRRSAILQTLSATNFINWSDNNPLKVAAAFANQPQYWSDFAMIFNSDKLKQRRSGLQTDVNQAEIANEAKGAKNKASAVIAYLLKIGFTPTQIADSFAIAAGGSSFYRNRVNTYLKDGMKQKAAEAQAFEDFSKTADEAQQSSDPYLVSQEQRSVLGRLVLAFQNTPMQYTRLMKKSMQDLANRRGDPKTHISKIIYYGAVQNFIFSALQSALFSIIPGFDEEDESEMTEKELEKLERKNDQRTLRIINSMTDSVLKGSGVRGAVIATLKNTITEYFKQEEKGFTADHTYTILQALSLSPPIGSKARKLYSAIQTKKFERDTLAARGFDVTADGKLNLSPAYSIIGSLASALGNVPLDRIVDELNSIVEALDIRNTTWQRIALALGWKTWDVGAKNEEHDLIKTEAKAKRKEEGKAKAKETRAKNKSTNKKPIRRPGGSTGPNIGPLQN